MTDTAKCEPPEALRGVDGDFWVERGGTQFVIPWLADPQCWQVAGYDLSLGRFVAQGYRYIGPVLTPVEAATLRAERDAAVAEVARLREALVKIRDAGLAPGVNSGQFTADLCCCVARAALNPEPAP